MALDQNAGKKKAVGLARNLFPNSPVESASESISPSIANTPVPTATTVAQAMAVNSSAVSVTRPTLAAGAATFAVTAKNLNRITKVSFMIDPELEKRFRKARLQSGFEKLEDAYNEAIKRFCDASEKGQIDNF